MILLCHTLISVCPPPLVRDIFTVHDLNHGMRLYFRYLRLEIVLGVGPRSQSAVFILCFLSALAVGAGEITFGSFLQFCHQHNTRSPSASRAIVISPPILMMMSSANMLWLAQVDFHFRICR